MQGCFRSQEGRCPPRPPLAPPLANNHKKNGPHPVLNYCSKVLQKTTVFVSNVVVWIYIYIYMNKSYWDNYR